MWFVLFLFVMIAQNSHRSIGSSFREIAYPFLAELVRRSQCDEVVKATGLGERFAYNRPRKITDDNPFMDSDPVDRQRGKRCGHFFAISTT